MKSFILLCLIFFATEASSEIHPLVNLHKNLHKPPLSGQLPAYRPYPFQTFTQKVDNFDSSNNNTWGMRYISNEDYYVEGGPIFVMIGGEYTINWGYVASGQMFEAASRHNGAVFSTEHRFYGQSQPTSSFSRENLKYLSADQALADLAHFIQYQRERLNSETVIVFGGSYPGCLASWIRLKYPHLVQAAVSSSGPVHTKSNFYEYMEVVNDDISFIDQECLEIIRNGTSDLEKMYETAEGIEEAENILKTCPPLTVDNTWGKAIIFQTIAFTFAGIVQEAQPGDIMKACNNLKSQKGTTASQKLANYVFNGGCANSDYGSYVRYYKDEDIQAEAGRQWLYQTCNELGYFQTSDSPNQPFGSSFPVQYNFMLCKDVFGDEFTQEAHEQRINRTHEVYGAIHPDVKKVIFTNGNVDPWHALGVLSDLNPLTPAIFINGSSHCADLDKTSPSDIPELAAAKRKVQFIIDKWLKHISQ